MESPSRRLFMADGLRLRQLIDRGVEGFFHVCDFGDDWRHRVIIANVRDGDADTDYPVRRWCAQRVFRTRRPACYLKKQPSRKRYPEDAHILTAAQRTSAPRFASTIQSPGDGGLGTP